MLSPKTTPILIGVICLLHHFSLEEVFDFNLSITEGRCI